MWDQILDVENTAFCNKRRRREDVLASVYYNYVQEAVRPYLADEV